MKRQLLGDSKDSFKWDYHYSLASELKLICAYAVNKAGDWQMDGS